jgi:hypothetical protein
VCEEAGDIKELSVLSVQFCCEFKTTLKNLFKIISILFTSFCLVY